MQFKLARPGKYVNKYVLLKDHPILIISKLILPCLALSPVPVLGMSLTHLLELVDIFAGRIAVVLGPVPTVAGILVQLPAYLFGHRPIVTDRGIGVLASVCIVSAGIHGGSKEQDLWKELHGDDEIGYK